jgi:hypothetical protein
MKIKSTTLLAAAGSLALIASAQAAVYFEDFESFAIDTDLDGQNGWSTTGDSFYAFSTDLGDGNMVAIIGGGDDALTNVTTTGITLPSGLSFISDAPNDSAFGANFFIVDSTNAVRDTFGFSLVGGMGEDLFTLIFTPDALPGVWDMSYTSIGGSDSFKIGLSDASITTGAYNFYVKFTAIDADNVAFDFKINDYFDSSGVLSDPGIAGLSMGGFNAFWSTTADNSGDNFMVFDNVSVIPEPSSAMLIGLGAVGLMLRRKRA